MFIPVINTAEPTNKVIIAVVISIVNSIYKFLFLSINEKQKPPDFIQEVCF